MGQAAVPEEGLEFSAGLKDLDFPTDPKLYVHALDAAIELLHADGGVLAMLDPTGQRLLIRRQRAIGVLEANYTALAALGRSLPLVVPGGSVEETKAPELEQTRPLPALLPGSGAAGTAHNQNALPGAGESAAPENSEPTINSPADMPDSLAPGYAWGQGLLGHIWEMNQALILSNEKCQALPRDATTPPDQDVAWHIGAPIRVPDPVLPLAIDEPAPVVGVIAVAFRDKHWSPTRRHAELLQLHADRVALALQAAWLEETRHRQARLLHLLHDATLHFSTTLNQEQLFAELHQLIIAVLGNTSFAILLYHQDKEEVEIACVAEKAPSPKRRIVKEKHIPAWWKKIRDGSIVSISTPEERQEHAQTLQAGWLTGESFESMLIVPLLTRTREHVIGALGVASQEPRSYTREQIEMLETIAHTAAFAFENADLYNRSTLSQEQARNRKRQVAALNNAVNTLNSSLNLDEILKSLVEQASLLTSAQVCTVLLFEQGENMLVARASNANEKLYRAWSAKALEEFQFEPPGRLLQQLKAGERVLLDNLEVERASQAHLSEIYRRFDIHSILLVPILRQDSPLLGTLGVYTPGERHIFKPDEIALLEGLAGQAAVAIHNARLYMDLEKALEQQKELDGLKDEFIVTASHEFRTPLSAIHGYASLLQRHSTKLTMEQARRFSTEITRAAQQLVGMVTTLMDASRLDSHKFSLSLQPVEIGPLAESALALIQPDIQQPIHLDIPAGLWVYADPERLRQVMTNLLTNAGKYSPPSAPIDFVARVEQRFTLPEAALTGKSLNQAGASQRASAPAPSASGAVSGASAQISAVSSSGAAPAGAITQEQPSTYLIVSVVDRGDGISPDDQKRLFQKFVRLQRSLTTPVRGTGLGLYICRQYLTAMGGAIWVESTPGQGSAFSFALPLVAASPNASADGAIGTPS
jgi:signal transduction histidine kinase